MWKLYYKTEDREEGERDKRNDRGIQSRAKFQWVIFYGSRTTRLGSREPDSNLAKAMEAHWLRPSVFFSTNYITG